MIFPDFLKKGDTIGICALSAGIGKKLDEYLESVAALKKEGYKILETESVRNEDERANTALKRAEELDELVNNDEVKMIICAAGGDSQFETVPYIDYGSIRQHPKWIMGMSDPTNLLFPVTTMLDIATIYGFNGSSYTLEKDAELINNLKIIRGNLIKQKAYDQYIDFLDLVKEEYNYKDVSWKGAKPLNVSGRCIGGCLDCIEKLIGTEFDYVSDFIERYKNDGIVWYFDNFATDAYNTYLSLLEMKNAGYFRHCKAVLFGRVAIPATSGSELISDYEEAYRLALEDIPYVSEMDIGHTKPRITMINGAIIHVKYEGEKGEIRFDLDNKEEGEKEMALIRCPECGREVSELATECIHCGFPLVEKEELVSIVDNLTPVTEETIEAYDVMLVDYGDSKFRTASNLRSLLDITYKEAYSILATLPCYIYNDIPQGDAEYIARKLMNMNMRVAVYDPVGNVRYYEPPKYINRPLPVVAPIPRVRRVVRPNPVIHYQPMPGPSPLMPHYNQPFVVPKKKGPTININIGNDPAPKKNTYTTKPKTQPKTQPKSSFPGGGSAPKKTSTPSFTTTRSRNTTSSHNTSSRPSSSSRPSPASRSGGTRSSGNRISGNSRGKR
ncbi:MAG: LD-carboxypeptidase [Erysipelotrichaceae bacterium]|nr:LD-carboxypeptidase [Erysipelotrichaceae bacterium]